MLASGATLIAQAVDLGLISAVLKLAVRLHRLSASFQDLMGQTLFKILHQYPSYHSFLRSVSRALRRADRLGVSEENAGPLWNSWTQFHSAAMAELMIKEDFDRNCPSETCATMIGCNNKKVKSISTFPHPV